MAVSLDESISDGTTYPLRLAALSTSPMNGGGIPEYVAQDRPSTLLHLWDNPIRGFVTIKKHLDINQHPRAHICPCLFRC